MVKQRGDRRKPVMRGREARVVTLDSFNIQFEEHIIHDKTERGSSTAENAGGGNLY